VVPSDEDAVDDRSVADMLSELERKIQASESHLSTWKDIRAAAERDAVEARQVVYNNISTLMAS